LICVICGLALVKELPLHLPVAQVELPLRATAQAGSIGSAFAGERPAELCMPTTKYSRYKIANFSSKCLHDVLPLSEKAFEH
jgi:hypothetical protein